MTSKSEAHPHYPYPKLDIDEARNLMKKTINDSFSKVMAIQVKLSEWREYKNKQAAVFKEAEKLNGVSKLQLILSLPLPFPITPYRIQIIAPAGIGKTTAVIDNLERCVGMIIWIMTPTIDLGREIQTSIKEKSPNIQPILIEGRNTNTCERSGVAQYIGKHGISVQDNLCKNGDDVCPFYHTCLYQQQRGELRELSELEKASPPRIFILTHSYLTIPSGLPDPDFVIIDESHWQNFICNTSESGKHGEKDLTLAELRNAGDSTLPDYDSYVQVMEEISKAMIKNPKFYLNDIRTLNLSRAISHIEDVISKHAPPNNQPSFADDKIRNSLQKWKRPRFNLIRDILKIIQFEISENKYKPTSITFNTENDTIRIHQLKINMIAREIPVLMIDASANLKINQKIWGHYLESVEIRTERNVNIIQVRQRTFSKTSIGIPYNSQSDWLPSEESLLLRNQLIDFIRDVVENSSQITLVVASKSIEEMIKTYEIKNIITTHYGALRGKNSFELLETAIIVGREEPSRESVEGLARALLSRNSETLCFEQDFIAVSKARSMKGGLTEDERVRISTDSLTQNILEQIREKEIEQALDRLRLINRDKPKTIYLLTSVVIDATISESKTWQELSRITKMDQAVQRAFLKSKAFPLSDRDIATCFPDLWSSQDAVGSYITRHGGLNGVVLLIRYYIGNDPLSIVEYRKSKNQKRWSKAVISNHEKDPKAALEEIIGEVFEVKLYPVRVSWTNRGILLR